MKQKKNAITVQQTEFYQEELLIHFDGDNFIDVNTLISYMSGLNKAYQAIVSAEYHNPVAKIQIVAINKGSFELNLMGLIGLAPDLISKAPVIISSFKQLMEIMKLKCELKGEKPAKIEQQGEKCRIVNHEGKVSYHNCTVANYYLSNPLFDKAFVEAFSPLAYDSQRKSVHMTSGEHSITIGKPNLKDMAQPIIEKPQESDNTQISHITTFLKIRKLDFVGDTKWGFIGEDGKTILAEIEDELFLKRIREGKAFVSANTILKVCLRIELKTNRMMDVTDKRFFVERVLSENKPAQGEQIAMDLETL